ncbi:hypothetical protein L6164_037113 [Bauhinia variegata]|uniref:Uncharacterized protein n=1 Tax=Bauhinia variegata TaxID=167791 RepID=A0ACB9KJ33_BAUVA|nr:hypothetical protein L6164_037113 [Bauhinia variegata]
MKTTFLALCFLLFAYSVGKEAEPKDVVLDPEESPGLPVRFESPRRARYIASSFFLNIRFLSNSSDQEIRDISEEFPIGWTVRVSDTKSLFGPFRVERAQRGYKIVYYPDRGETGGDIRLAHRDSKYRLAVKDGDPFIFKIKKATEESSAGIMNIV